MNEKPNKFLMNRTGKTAPPESEINALAKSIVDLTPDEIRQKESETTKENDISWLHSPDETLKPAFTFRLPQQLSDQLKEVADQTGISQNFTALEATWISCLAKVAQLHPNDERVKDSIREVLNKNRRGWRGRTLNDVLDEQLELLRKLKESL